MVSFPAVRTSRWSILYELLLKSAYTVLLLSIVTLLIKPLYTVPYEVLTGVEKNPTSLELEFGVALRSTTVPAGNEVPLEGDTLEPLVLSLEPII